MSRRGTAIVNMGMSAATIVMSVPVAVTVTSMARKRKWNGGSRFFL